MIGPGFVRARVSLVVVACLAVVVTGCGSGEPSARPSATAPTLTAGSPSSSGSPRPASIPPRRQTSSPGTTTGSTTSSRTTRLDKACVRRATDTQGITIFTSAGGPASYGTVYSDGSTITDRPDDYSSGGQGAGFADGSGRFRQTWVVPAAAPTGDAVVHVNTGPNPPAPLHFRIVAENGRC